MGFSKAIIKWYHKNKRDLPFRKTKDPYKVWLSEIILQQTRVSQGLPYYEKFVRLFPTIHHLAKAQEGAVLKSWQGLGYYSRARNLHATAKIISTKHKGIFPNEFEEIKKLKGIGDYTAGAIASLAFGKPHAVVDGNVFRVLSRCFGISTPIDSSEGKKQFARLAEKLLDRKEPGTFNQAVMEFGALQCVPVNPDCTKCPLNKNCTANREKRVDALPVKSKKTSVRSRYFNYFIHRNNGKILIRKRIEKDIWRNLYDFPMIETDREMKSMPFLRKATGQRNWKNEDNWKIGNGTTAMITVKHQLSHQTLFVTFWNVKQTRGSLPLSDPKYLYINENQINKYAFPRLIEHFFEEKNEGKSKIV